MVRTRSGKESNPDDARIPPLPPDDDQPSTEIPDQQLLAMKKKRPEKVRPRFIIENDNLADSLQRMHLHGTKPSSSKTSSLEMETKVTSSSKPSEEAVPGEPVNSKEDATGTAAIPLENIPSLWDDVGYLAPNFNPSDMKVAMLRNILCRHNVHYSSADAKKTLVQIFSEEITPRAAATLTAMGKVVPSNDGITDVHQGND
ncbi:hypothetical protein CcaCcLH18_12134 [Colletotrichum camelliae]|nr:hypothetical protein CcaCcLH18_12134 [Colletotrichum camelliae]